MVLNTKEPWSPLPRNVTKDYLPQNKKADKMEHSPSYPLIRGFERIRTAVEGFADLCLATRPPDHFFRIAKVINYLLQANFF